MNQKSILSVLGTLVFILVITVTVVYTRAADPQDATTTATITNTAPVVDEVRISTTAYGTDSFAAGIPLNVGANKTIHVTGVVSDANGEDDIASTSVTLYRTSVGSSCTPDQNDCYTLSACTLDLATAGDTEVLFDCELSLAYWTDATADAGRFASDDWTALVTVTDQTPISSSLTKVVEVNSLLALNIPTAINYGARVLGEQSTAANNVETVLTQRGNTKADVELQGTAMTCDGVGTIPVANQRWSLTDVAYASSTNNLSTTATAASRNVDYRESESTELASSLYWNIGIPATGVQGSCVGNNTISILAVPVDQGTLLDSKLIGVSYTSAHQSGITDSNGSFFYTPGDTVLFTIGSCTLGSISNINADSKVFITEIAGLARSATTDSKTIKLARFLQTIDDDNDNSNGIAITNNTQSVLASGCGDIQTSSDATLASLVATAYSGRSLKSAAAAQAHLEDTLITETGAVFQDTTPSAFSFTNQTGVAQNSTITSNAVTLTGFDGTLTATCTGCTAIGKNGVFTNSTSLAGFAPSDTIQLRLTSSAPLNTTVTASVVLGGTTSGTWSVTTTNQDTTPDAFSFTDQTGVALNSIITSNAVTLTGFTGTLTATCANCAAIGKNGVFTNGTSLAGFAPNDTIQLRRQSPTTAGTVFTATVSVGNTTGTTWSIETASVITDANGNTYDTVTIGTQTWLATNMNVGTMLGSGVSTPSNSNVIEKWCYEDSVANCTNQGGFYSWSEAMQGSTTEGAQGICPSGYHIPTDNEYKTLEIYLGMTQVQADADSWRGTDQGTKLKVGGSSGFNAPMSGYRHNNSTFFNQSTLTILWTSTQLSNIPIRRMLNASVATVFRSAVDPMFGVSVRCIKN